MNTLSLLHPGTHEFSFVSPNAMMAAAFEAPKLRPHQQDAIGMLRASLRAGHKRPLIMAPCGFGKTVVAGNIVSSALAKGKRVIFTVPAISLVDQALSEFANAGIWDVGVIQGDHPQWNPAAPVQIASVQTLCRRAIPRADLVLIDEAHKMFDFYGKWMAMPEWQNVPFVGLSATPWTKGLGKLFDDLIIAETTQGLIDKGYLSPFDAFGPPSRIKPDLSKVHTKMGDYVESELSAEMQKQPLVADTVQTWLDKGENRPTIVFAVDRAHAGKLHDQFVRAGVPAEYVDAFTSRDDRKAIGRRLKSGETKVVVNIGCLTTGVDWPFVSCIVLARPTKSEMLYCLDSETEILTSHGWKGMGEVEAGDCAATMADIVTGRGQWARVKGVIERPMESTENWVEYDAPRANFRVTDQHTMIAAGGNDRTRAYRRMTALELAALNGGAYMPTAVQMDQPGVPLTDAELYFIGMMMSDGTWTSTCGAITQSERHPEIVDRIERCLQECGIGYAKRIVKSSEGGMIERYRRWRFDFSAGKPKAHGNTGRGPLPTKRHAEHVPGHTGFIHLVPYLDKSFAPALMGMSRSQLDVFLQGLWDGDGSKKLGVDYTPQSMEICSARPRVMDRLQALCALNGYTANVRKEHGASRNTPIWFITITPKDWRSCGGYDSRPQKSRPKIEVKPTTQERVWCVQTDTGTIITRRRGKVTVMGNCQIIGRGLRTHPGKVDCKILDHSDTTARLGFVTDIHHDTLDDGSAKQSKAKKEQEKNGERGTPLPKECDHCGYLKPAGVRKCKCCGWEPRRQSDIENADGELVALNGKAIKADKSTKQAWYSQLLAIANERHGVVQKKQWAAHKYKDKFGVWPRSLSEIRMIPTIEVRNFVRAKDIAWSKSKGRAA